MQLVRSMIGVVMATASLCAIAKGDGSSLCKAAETTIFNCSVSGSTKFVSLCGSKDVTRDAGYIKYRFGRPGKIELEYPSGTKDTQQKFRYAHYWRSEVDRTEVTFDVNQHSYTLFDSSEGNETTAERVRGISIALPTNEKRELLCGSDATGTLGAVESIAACDKASPLNMDGCPVK
ncbi:MAG TPA: hypothetical protein VLJ86_09940 [Ramlibacter sp.]|nr:hypothetical protein [Ramlibacter sp.]